MRLGGKEQVRHRETTTLRERERTKHAGKQSTNNARKRQYNCNEFREWTNKQREGGGRKEGGVSAENYEETRIVAAHEHWRRTMDEGYESLDRNVKQQKPHARTC